MTVRMPQRIADIDELEELLSEPDEALIDSFDRTHGDIMVLGAGGKMGPTLARMARRAADRGGGTSASRRVIAVSRYSDPRAAQQLKKFGVETISCDLMEEQQLNALPDCPNIVYMAGMKFGSSGNQPLTWAMNVDLPARVCRRFASARFAAFSTGNVNAMAKVTRGGSLETDEPGPVGEYAMSCLGRERMFEHAARTSGTPVSILRLSYAVEMRYGVLLDTAEKVFHGHPVDLNMGNLVAIWQRDANAQALRSLEHASCPALILNITGPEFLSVRQLALRFAEEFGRPPVFAGEERGEALLSCTQKSQALFGYPFTPIEKVIQWTADWVKRGMPTLKKPTHYETTDGKF
jgi:nucleoside-diphosphate-sugar epimerase